LKRKAYFILFLCIADDYRKSRFRLLEIRDHPF
jgi:hypothetical protein